ncbi:MAG: dipeptidase PepE [Chitinophagaceae bacterium]|nr:MAG: dipeptidase PepE [Chitinophagaceae bacterium]
MGKNPFFPVVFPKAGAACPATFDSNNLSMLHQILALSSSRVGGGGYLEAALPLIREVLGDEPRTIAFLPFAAVGISDEAYGDRVRAALEGLPYKVEVHSPENARTLLSSCDAIMVGGGNTFKLLSELYRNNLIDRIRNRVLQGIPYIGWSAGSNVIGRSICTTNDMPIVQPDSFLALRLINFQINPHYHNIQVPGFHGETRDDRLTEFCQLNPGIPVLALPEGTALHLYGEELRYRGNVPGYLFTGGPGRNEVQREELAPGTDLGPRIYGD